MSQLSSGRGSSLSSSSLASSSLASSYLTETTYTTASISQLSSASRAQREEQAAALMTALEDSSKAGPPRSAESSLASEVSALRDRARGSRRKAESSSAVSGSRVTASTGTALSGTSCSGGGQVCAECNFRTFVGDKFCGGCGLKLLTRSETESRSRSSASGVSRRTASRLSAAGKSRTSRRSLSLPSVPEEPRVPSLPPVEREPLAAAKVMADRVAQLGAKRSEREADAMARKVEADAVKAAAEEKIRYLAARAASCPALKQEPDVAVSKKPKKFRRLPPKSVASWLAKENWIGTQWTQLMHPRKAGEGDGPVLRAFNPPEPPLGREPKKGEW